MNRKVETLLILLCCVALSCCCTKKDCRTLDDITEIQLVGFSTTDVDSIALETYSDSLETRLDSTMLGAEVSGSYMAITFPAGFHLEHFYRLTNLSTGQSDVLGNFVTKKLKCNTCFPNKSKGYIIALKSYELNGSRYNEEVLSIAKTQ